MQYANANISGLLGADTGDKAPGTGSCNGHGEVHLYQIRRGTTAIWKGTYFDQLPLELPGPARNDGIPTPTRCPDQVTSKGNLTPRYVQSTLRKCNVCTSAALTSSGGDLCTSEGKGSGKPAIVHSGRVCDNPILGNANNMDPASPIGFCGPRTSVSARSNASTSSSTKEARARTFWWLISSMPLAHSCIGFKRLCGWKDRAVNRFVRRVANCVRKTATRVRADGDPWAQHGWVLPLIKKLTFIIILPQRVGFATQLVDSCICSRYRCAYHPRSFDDLEDLCYSFVMGISFHRQPFKLPAMFPKSAKGDRVGLSAHSEHIPKLTVH